MSTVHFTGPFRFFDLPQEMRDMVYSFLTKPNPVFALIKPPQSADSVVMAFINTWFPPLLLVDKQFGQEYFAQVRERRLDCQTMLNSDTSRRLIGNKALNLQENPGPAIKGLAKARYLVTIDGLDDEKLIASFCEGKALTDTLRTLLALMPKLKTYRQIFCTDAALVTIPLEDGDASFLRAIHHHFQPHKEMEFQNSLRKCGIENRIEYQPGFLVGSRLSSDIVEGETEGRGFVVFAAAPGLGVKEDWLWYGLELRAVMMKDEEGQ